MRLSYGEAIREAIYEELLADKNVCFLGEDIRYNLYAYSEGLLDCFGSERVIDVPLSEAAVMGVAIGSSMCGVRPILDLTISNFLYVAMDQIVSMAAKTRYQYNGEFKLPLTILASSAYGVSAGAQHSDRLHAMLMGVPGIKVIVPASVQDMYSMLRAAIQDDNPVICFTDKTLFYDKEDMDKRIEVPLGKAQVRKYGQDISLIGIQNCANLMMEVAKELEQRDISAEVIDVRSLVPFDKESIFRSVKKTGKVVIADSANRTCGAAANIASLLCEEQFDSLKAPVKIVATEDVPLPYSSVLEKELIPSKEKILQKVNDLLGLEKY